MREVLIVDGYNIIGAWPELQHLKDIELEEAREKLIEMISNYQAYSGMKTIIVFDAHQVPGRGGKYEQRGIDIWFTKEKETADEVIERLVAELNSRRRRIFVATSDLVEQHVIFGKGALRISARELLIEVQDSQREISKKITFQQETSRNTFDSKLSYDMKKLFEKWRRGQK